MDHFERKYISPFLQRLSLVYLKEAVKKAVKLRQYLEIFYNRFFYNSSLIAIETMRLLVLIRLANCRYLLMLCYVGHKDDNGLTMKRKA